MTKRKIAGQARNDQKASQQHSKDSKEKHTMAQHTPRPLFVQTELICHNLAVNAAKRPDYLTQNLLKGVISDEEVQEKIDQIRKLDIDAYIQATIAPSEHANRLNAKEAICSLGGKMIQEESDGQLYFAETEFVIGTQVRRIGFIAQNRAFQNGAWTPRQHWKAAEKARFFASHGMPVVSFIDTPGAMADELANQQNQSHSISFLIAEMANLQVPTVGVIWGQGYSGGAIPFAASNLLLSVRDGVFATIHPKGLSNISKKYNLSWEECAKYIGSSAYELYANGYCDGVIDYSPGQSGNSQNLRLAILSAIESIEEGAKKLLRTHDFFFDHYRDSINHYLNPSKIWEEDNVVTDKTPTGLLNIFGEGYRFLRYVNMRLRITSGSSHSYSQLSNISVPSGNLKERLNQSRIDAFEKWLQAPLEMKYEESLQKKLKKYLETEEQRDSQRSKFAEFFIGNPKKNYSLALNTLTSEIVLYLYNYWKQYAVENLILLYSHLKHSDKIEVKRISNPTLLETVKDPNILQEFLHVFPNMILFDLLHDALIENFHMIAAELCKSNSISQESVGKLFDLALQKAMQKYEQHSIPVDLKTSREDFFIWLANFVSRKNCDAIMQTISGWKQLALPRVNPALFGLARYYFSSLLPSWSVAEGGGTFDGTIAPRNIGINNFWQQLDRAYKDLQIQELLNSYKKQTISPQQIIDYAFKDFKELNENLMTADPVQFPGFRDSIDKSIKNNIPPSGVLTGIATYHDDGFEKEVGVVVSNTLFQVGAFDMASCEKVCMLLAECTQKRLPVIFFISSGGMQTKEGPGSLFSMAIMNDRLTRFIKTNDLPVICFGFRDCMGGAQASFVTHRLAKTYYLSGALISFAGQLVVESHLPMNSILADYLSDNHESMEGLVQNPFDENIGDKLSAIDPEIPLAKLTIHEVISRILQGQYQRLEVNEPKDQVFEENIFFRPIQRILIHARGCTATRLIHAAHDAGKEIVLVQSDADMDSYPTRLLKENDQLVCLGGNTPQESYLNAMSVIRIAEKHGVDALHPGIGFLSESARFAAICRKYELSFIGPTALNMERMGNKTNAISTAKELGIPVVPGSDGALTDPQQALEVAKNIGFPVLIKAAHGGGGKGIQVVEKEESFVSIFRQMSQEAYNAFGNGDLYLEKYIASMRHIEVQILRDSKNTSKSCHIVGIRDCSIQRNYQKLVEESANLHKALQEELASYSTKIANHINYIGVGTVEFIYDLTDEQVYFMEMNTRLQVEHPVTEATAGIDLVQKQIEVSEGKSLASLKTKNEGHAIELRMTAERIDLKSDGTVAFLPDPGKVLKAVFPKSEDVRVFAAIGDDSFVPPYYDSLVAQIIAHGQTRAEAIDKLSKYLKNVKITGISTNLAFMKTLLADEVFHSGTYDTNFIHGFFKRVDFAKLIKKTKRDAGESGSQINRSAITINESNELKVLAAQTATFYRSVNPEDPSLVEADQVVGIKDPLCLLESMKVFSEISLASFNTETEILYPEGEYKVVRIFPENAQTVTSGDLLFIIEPVKST